MGQKGSFLSIRTFSECEFLDHRLVDEIQILKK
jgi:hypothetical protein